MNTNIKTTSACLIFLIIVILFTHIVFAQQIKIDRIDRMPNLPVPYEMRNWKQVALGYDELVFDFNLTGQYLPLIRWNTNTVNYPEHDSFILHTVVGTPNPDAGEAINILPAVISASLVGLDKSNQNGHNWVLMCEEFFNNRPGEYVYLNNAVTSSGHDWWYDTMPNVFFYQLYDMYPNTGDFDYQFTSVANRWLIAVEKMGGSTTPWQHPYMNYRAWKLSTMTPLEVGVKQPEAAGAIAWLLYHAYVKTGDSQYRIGAEWAMEFLNNWLNNPSYELQLPYGVYIAARMNAELGTNYDIEKMINWCFDANDNVRNWGAILGNWGGYDCYGLIGEAKYAGYAFAMNGFEQAGALVPMVRYENRFARAIGKWMLNLTNASRLFYTNYLPDENQDSEEWAHQYDPNSYIAHESMREYALHTGTSPYATGDAIRGGWGETNLALYGASHVGIFGSIIDTTNVEKILRLDATVTDYFQEDNYPTYLYFNPYDEEKTVLIDVGSDLSDLYDAVSNSFLKTGVSGITSFDIPADEAVLTVVTPSIGNVTYDLDKMMIAGVIVDYKSGQDVQNYPPRIKSLAAQRELIAAGDSTIVYCTAGDKDGDELTYTWETLLVTEINNEGQLSWITPDSIGIHEITCIVEDGKGGQDSASVNIEVVESINHPPVILSLTADNRRIELGTTSKLTCFASDPDEDNLNYSWSSKAGTFNEGDSAITWTAPGFQGFYYITCIVDDGRGGSAADSIGIVVQDSSNITTGIPVAFYPFNGNANDESGFDNHGTVHGPVLVEDRFENPNAAYHFNGSFDFIQVPNSSCLNFKEAITVSFWMKIDEFFSREAYPVSHGNWENRWKLSIIPEKKLRWTVKTGVGIKDLDSETQFVKNVFYNITALYNGSDFDIYINGALDKHATFSGSILSTNIDLTIGQALPNNPCCNFKGVLDDIRIYNYALTVEEIQNIYNEKTSIQNPFIRQVPDRHFLFQNYPNPFNANTTIRYQLKNAEHVTIEIFDILGRKVQTLVHTEKPAGYYFVLWDGRNYQRQYPASGIYIYKMRIGNFCEKRKFILLK